MSGTRIRENLLAILLFVFIVAAVILTSDSAPRWIYQGF